MLARTHRFHGHTSLNYVYRHGTPVRNSFLLVRSVRNQQRVDYRLAIIVSRKTHKSAVKRNRVRRRIYEIIRTGPPIVQAYDIVISVFSEQVITLKPSELTQLIRGLLRKAGVYQAPNRRLPDTPRAIVESREEKH